MQYVEPHQICVETITPMRQYGSIASTFDACIMRCDANNLRCNDNNNASRLKFFRRCIMRCDTSNRRRNTPIEHVATHA
jgi:hypothetical protein